MQYYYRNREKRVEYSRKYNKANKEKKVEYSRQYREKIFADPAKKAAYNAKVSQYNRDRYAKMRSTSAPVRTYTRTKHINASPDCSPEPSTKDPKTAKKFLKA